MTAGFSQRNAPFFNKLLCQLRSNRRNFLASTPWFQCLNTDILFFTDSVNIWNSALPAQGIDRWPASLGPYQAPSSQIRTMPLINSRQVPRRLSENALFPKLCVMLKKLSSEYQLYTCGNFFRKPWFWKKLLFSDSLLSTGVDLAFLF